MADEISARIADLKEELVGLRRDFHKYPELGFKEFRTQRVVKEYLEKLGLEALEIAGTGLSAVLWGTKNGRTLLLRSDMDAIPVEEDHDYEFRSVNRGVAHACGHDGHLAMMLGAAKILTGMKEQLGGNIKFVFQPNEEEAGAYRMIEEGIMENPPVGASMGIHLWSQVDSGNIDIDAGPVMAASHYFTLTIHGQGGHAGFSHEAVDPFLAAANIVQAVQAIQTREIDALHPAVIMFTEIHGGSSATIIPEKVDLKGSIRFLYQGGEELFERFERIIKHTCQAHRVSYTLNFSVGNHLLANDPKMADLARSAALEIVGDPGRVTNKVHTMAGEDFSDFMVDAPGVFVFLGTRNPQKNCIHPHHHPKFDIDEDVLTLGVELLVRTALKYFERK